VSDLGIQISKLLDQVGTSLADVQLYAFTVCIMLAVWDHTAPTAHLPPSWKTGWVADEAAKDRCTFLTDTIQGLQVAGRVDLVIEREHHILTQMVSVSF
jgi:hypothetical protein